MKPQDLVVALAIRLAEPPAPLAGWNYPTLADFTGLSLSQVHVACAGLRGVRLLRQDPGEPWMVSGRNLAEFVIHGARYQFPAAPGGPTRGVRTGRSTDAARGALGIEPAERTTVWPTLDGADRGQALLPLHACVLRCVAQPGSEQVRLALQVLDVLRLGEDADRPWAKDWMATALIQRRV